MNAFCFEHKASTHKKKNLNWYQRIILLDNNFAKLTFSDLNPGNWKITFMLHAHNLYV